MKRIFRLLSLSLFLIPYSYGMNTDSINPLDQQLIDAATVGDIDQVRNLITNFSVNVNAKGANNWTALHLAALSGHKEVIELLLKLGADSNAKTSYDGTALHWAAQYGHKEVVELLLKSGADINAKTSYDDTALHGAAEKGHKCIVEMLLAFNAQVPQVLMVHPLVIQAQKDQAELRVIKGFKAKAQLFNKGVYICPVIKELIDAKRELLLEAVKYNNVEKVKALLKEGFSLNTCGKDGNTLLHVAIAHNSQDVLKVLLPFCSKENPTALDKKNKHGLTPVEVAVAESNFELLRMLIAAGREQEDTNQKVSHKRYREDADQEHTK